MLLSVEQAPSLPAAAEHLRTDIELPGALRYLRRLCQSIHRVLGIARGLLPTPFVGVALTLHAFAEVLAGYPSVLMALREQLSDYLPGLPAPLGFNPSRGNAVFTQWGIQHRMGRDPPFAILEAHARTGRRPDIQE